MSFMFVISIAFAAAAPSLSHAASTRPHHGGTTPMAASIARSLRACPNRSSQRRRDASKSMREVPRLQAVVHGGKGRDVERDSLVRSVIPVWRRGSAHRDTCARSLVVLLFTNRLIGRGHNG